MLKKSRLLLIVQHQCERVTCWVCEVKYGSIAQPRVDLYPSPSPTERQDLWNVTMRCTTLRGTYPLRVNS